jgi:hypothetical protein
LGDGGWGLMSISEGERKRGVLVTEDNGMQKMCLDDYFMK